MHEICSGIRGKLKLDPTYRCSRCLGLARPIDNRPTVEIEIDDDKLEVVDCFCYLGDMICPGGGCELSSITRIRSAWGKFRELLPLLTSRSISFITKGEVYTTYVHSVMLHASECWAPTQSVVLRLRRNDRTMIRWICGVRLEDRISSSLLLQRLKIPGLDVVLRYNRLRWHGHVERSSGWINRVQHLQVDGNCGRGRPKKTWSSLAKEDCRAWNMSSIDRTDRHAWRSALKTSVKNSLTCI